MIRTLEEEVGRVMRSRVVNPKWINGVKRHGYKGAFEMAATVDYLFGYDATAGVMADWMYEQLTQQYVLDPENRKFMTESNPWALHGIVERLSEALPQLDPSTFDMEAFGREILQSKETALAFLIKAGIVNKQGTALAKPYRS